MKARRKGASERRGSGLVGRKQLRKKKEEKRAEEVERGKERKRRECPENDINVGGSRRDS